MWRFITLALLYFWAIVNVNESMMSIGLYIAVPGAFVTSFACNKENIFKNKYIKIFVLFYSWILFTWFFAINEAAATRHLQRLIGVFMLTIAVCNLSTDHRNRPWLYGLYVVVFLVAFNYAQQHILTIQFSISSNRLDDDRLNANVLANYTVYATFALFVLGNIINKKRLSLVFRILFLLMIPLTFIIAILTASRQVLLVQVPLFGILLYLRYYKQAKLIVRVRFVGCAIIAVLISAGAVMETYDNSYLKQRSEIKIEDDSRFRILGEAIAVGNKYPLTGAGPGNFYLLSSDRVFSHCSYTEAYANCGIIGVAIYLYLIFCFMKSQWQRYKETRDKIYLAYATFGLIYTFYNLFYVFYSDLWLMSYFMFVACDSFYMPLSNRSKMISHVQEESYTS